jgi:hypothetical protein
MPSAPEVGGGAGSFCTCVSTAEATLLSESVIQETVLRTVSLEDESCSEAGNRKPITKDK